MYDCVQNESILRGCRVYRIDAFASLRLRVHDRRQTSRNHDYGQAIEHGMTLFSKPKQFRIVL